MSRFPYAKRQYDIQPYDPAWTTQFAALAEKIKEIFGDEAKAIEHIGSTAVPGMEGKSTIDVLVLVSDSALLDVDKERMEAAGYVYEGQMVTHDSRLYREVREGEISANIHVFPKDHPHAREMLRLRNYLCAHPKDAQEYSKLKRELKQRYPNDYAAYHKEKDVFLDGILKKRLGIFGRLRRLLF